VVLAAAATALGGCDVLREAGEVTVGGLATAGKVTLGGLETAGRATVGGLQWVADAGETGIRGRMHGSTEKPFILVTGLRFPGIKLSELSVVSLQAVDGKGKDLGWDQGAWIDSKFGPALTITIQSAKTTTVVDIVGVLMYRGGRWVLTARCVRLPGESAVHKGHPWRTQTIDVVRQ